MKIALAPGETFVIFNILTVTHQLMLRTSVTYVSVLQLFPKSNQSN